MGGEFLFYSIVPDPAPILYPLPSYATQGRGRGIRLAELVRSILYPASPNPGNFSFYATQAGGC